MLEDRHLAEEFEAHEMSRRKLLAGALGFAAALGIGGCAAPSDADDENTEASEDELRARRAVGIGYDATSVGKAIDAALAETRGLASIARGDSVYLKVNTNSGDPAPYSTSPELLEHLGGLLRDKGVTDIRIGDRSFWGDNDTAGNFRRNGIAAAAQRLGTRAVVFDDDVEWVTLPADSMPDWVGAIRIPTMVATAKHIINLANMKTHFITGFTMTLKNAIGIIHAADRKRRGNLFVHEAVDAKLGRQIAQISKAITPTMNLIDGWRALITGGPTPHDRTAGRGGGLAQPKIVIASIDRIAADLTGVAVLRSVCPPSEPITQGKPFEHPQLTAAMTHGGLGITKRSQYVLRGPTVENLAAYKADAIR
ncbi:MAG: DUF362 domain-containing protein [Labilithrix sp.]|nr:DUF362 domain-containing protein [Labilithrix sp.]